MEVPGLLDGSLVCLLRLEWREVDLKKLEWRGETHWMSQWNIRYMKIHLYSTLHTCTCACIHVAKVVVEEEKKGKKTRHTHSVQTHKHERNTTLRCLNYMSMYTTL